jgi:hypothetical protein
MAKQSSGVLLPFDHPATYQISIQGRFDPKWADRLDDMRITKSTGEPGKPTITILEGYLPDQTALAGVLNTLYELHLTVLLVKRLET